MISKYDIIFWYQNMISKSHQPLATGGLEPSWNPHPNIHSTPSPPTPWRRGLPLRLSSSPGTGMVVSRAGVATKIQFFRHPGYHHFFIIFRHPFISILTAFWLPTWSQNRSKIHKKSIPRVIWKTSNLFHRFFSDFSCIWHPQNLKSRAHVSTGS